MTKTKLGNYCEILNIDLSREIPAAILSSSCAGVYLGFWWQDIPLGQDYIDCDGKTLSRKEIIKVALRAIAPAVESYCAGYGLSSEAQFRSSERRQDLLADFQGFQEKMRQALGESTAHTPDLGHAKEEKVSIVLPTCNRPEKLSDCLKSLQALRRPPHEIIVVDNAPRMAGARRVLHDFPSARYIAEDRTGASVARNTGVRQSNGSIIVFIDDDETVHPDWLSWLISCFEDSRMGIATGLVLPAELHSEAQLIFEKRFSFNRGYVPALFDTAYYQKHRNWGVPVWEVGGSGNMAIRRAAFDQLGGFDERLGAGRAGCSEDSELFYNAMVHGWRCRYEPRAVTFHIHRPDIDSLKNQLFFYMRGHVAALLMQYSKYQDIGNLCRLFIVLPMVYLKHLMRGLARDPAFRFHFLRAEILGCFSGMRFYLHNRGKT